MPYAQAPCTLYDQTVALNTSETKMVVFWVVVPYNLLEVYLCFRGTCCLHHQDDEAASTSEMLVNFYQTTWRYSPEDRLLHSDCHENLKSYQEKLACEEVLVNKNT
jgi:hypothetical protein